MTPAALRRYMKENKFSTRTLAKALNEWMDCDHSTVCRWTMGADSKGHRPIPRHAEYFLKKIVDMRSGGG